MTLWKMEKINKMTGIKMKAKRMQNDEVLGRQSKRNRSNQAQIVYSSFLNPFKDPKKKL